MAKNIVQRPAPNINNQPVVSWILDDFEALVWNKGYDVVIERMVKCPCKGRDGGFLSDCQNCQGTGYIFINPFETRVVLHSMNYNTQYKEWSEEKRGQVNITSIFRDRLSFMDRITVIDSSAILNELVQLRQYENTKYLYTIYDIISVIDIFVFNSSSIPLTKLIEGVDYTFERNKIIILTNYEVSRTFSVRYSHKVQYHVLDLVHDIRNSSKKDITGLKSEQFPINAIGRMCHYNITSLDFTGGNIIDNSYIETTLQ